MKLLFENWRHYLTEEIKLAIERAKDIICPAPTQNLELNTANRDRAIREEHIKYGPLNLEDEEYWVGAAEHWSTTPDIAKKSRCSNCTAFDISPRMKECIPIDTDESGELGYCWMHHFKCHSERACYTWAAGGPIDSDEQSGKNQENNPQALEDEPLK